MDRGPARSTPLGRRAKPRVVLEREVAYHLEGETRENMTAAQFEDLTENEAEEILRWRFSELLRVGYDTDAATGTRWCSATARASGSCRSTRLRSVPRSATPPRPRVPFEGSCRRGRQSAWSATLDWTTSTATGESSATSSPPAAT